MKEDTGRREISIGTDSIEEQEFKNSNISSISNLNSEELIPEPKTDLQENPQLTGNFSPQNMADRLLNSLK